MNETQTDKFDERLKELTFEQQIVFAAMVETYDLFAKVFSLTNEEAYTLCERSFERNKKIPELKTTIAIMATTQRAAIDVIRKELNHYNFSKPYNGMVI